LTKSSEFSIIFSTPQLREGGGVNLLGVEKITTTTPTIFKNLKQHLIKQK